VYNGHQTVLPEEITFKLPEDTAPDLIQTYRIAHGDQLRVSVLGDDSSARIVTVDPDGNIHYLQLQSVSVVGMSILETEELLTRLLATEYKDPNVLVANERIRGHRFYVFGEVTNPGGQIYSRPTRILDAIAQAGGLTTARTGGLVRPSVDLKRSVLVRNQDVLHLDFHALIQQGDLRYNILLHPNDILVFSSFVEAEIYVLGAVNTPGVQPYTSGLHLIGALARGGSIAERAWRKSVVIIRGNINKPTVYIVDINKILSGLIHDIELEPGDIIYLPDRPTQYARELILSAINIFVSVLGARAGSGMVNSLLE
jgi:polysaccharide export outer membrane protein